jgi:hypothetical protein
LGGIVLLDLALRLRDLEVFYTDTGVLPRAVMLRESWHSPGYDLFLASGDRSSQLLLFALTALAAASLMLGYRTRLAGLATWFMVGCLQLRNPLLLDGGDDLLRVMLFWTPFLPLAARWSLDARAHPEWARLPDRYASLATAGYLLQVCLLYLFAGLLKSDPVWRRTGEALYYTLSIDQFATSLAHHALGHPELLRSLTFATLGLELGLPALLLCPWKTDLCRGMAVLAGWLFHLCTALLLHLGLFMPIAMVSLLGLIPSSWLDRLRPRAAEPAFVEDIPPGYQMSWPVRIFLGLVMLYLVGINMRSLQNDPPKIPPMVRWFTLLTRENQSWYLFAPHPFVDDGWFWVEAFDTAGRPVRLLGGPDKPAVVAAEFSNQRWRRWLQNLREGYPNLQASYLDFLERNWVDQHPDRPLRSILLYYVEERTPPPGRSPEVQPRLLLERTYTRRVPLRFNLEVPD